MIVDVKLFIALIALLISLYSLSASRKISRLEKRTAVLAEVSELQLLVQEMTELHIGLMGEGLSAQAGDRLSAAGVFDLTQRGTAAVKSTYGALENKKKLSAEALEKLRPPVQALIAEIKHELEKVNALFGRTQ